ncbi:hypothetical protein [Microbacterium rhizomatis]|uniref:Uncharacterized protein n=1 Tax=Microbacterium rhizomatis TaxID=1631477 RepID=A0A5J5J017_9MICO|nr:hypothetical protein [Microbacterium rhizomatis]KAA9107647.1 hypothetical protein F6B43_09305 [Microbacterium rhizomatis]
MAKIAALSLVACAALVGIAAPANATESTAVERQIRFAPIELDYYLSRYVLPRTTCPAEAPYLSRTKFPSEIGWEIPSGVEVTPSGRIDAQIRAHAGEEGRGVIGGPESSVMNLAFATNTVVTITVHCTSAP